MATTMGKKVTSSYLPWIICTLGALFYCYEYFLRIAPGTMETHLRQTYHLNDTGYGVLIGFYYFAYTPMQLLVGILMDRFGPRRLLFISCLICALGAYLFACSNLLFVAELGRFLVGFGSAFAFVGVLTLATIWLPPNRFALISGMATALGMCGAIFGDITLTSFIKHEGWRDTVDISAFVGIILAFAIIFIIRNKEQSKLYKPSRESKSFTHLFITLKSLLRNPQIWIVGCVGMLCYTSASALAEIWSIPYLEHARHLSKAIATSTTSLIFVGWLAGGPIAGFISDKLSNRRLPILCGSLLTAVSLLALLYIPHLSHGMIMFFLFCIGFFSACQVIVFAMACELSEGKLAGTAIAFTNMFVMISGAVLQPLIGKFIDLQWHGLIGQHGEKIYSTQAYTQALLILPCCYIAVYFIVKYFLKETSRA